jgi:hypothetical protein
MDGCLQIMITHFVFVIVGGKGENWQPRLNVNWKGMMALMEWMAY